jgi:hypothetical protein
MDPEVYRLKAEECERLAERVATEAIRSSYRELAQHWRALAAQAEAVRNAS